MCLQAKLHGKCLLSHASKRIWPLQTSLVWLDLSPPCQIGGRGFELRARHLIHAPIALGFPMLWPTQNNYFRFILIKFMWVLHLLVRCNLIDTVKASTDLLSAPLNHKTQSHILTSPKRLLALWEVNHWLPRYKNNEASRHLQYYWRRPRLCQGSCLHYPSSLFLAAYTINTYPKLSLRCSLRCHMMYHGCSRMER